MANRKKRSNRHLHMTRMASALALSLTLAPTAAFAKSAMPMSSLVKEINLQGVVGETFKVDLREFIGGGYSYFGISDGAPSKAIVQIDEGFLLVNYKEMGSKSFVINASYYPGDDYPDTYKINLSILGLDKGTTGKVDIGDVVDYVNTVQDSHELQGLLSHIDAKSNIPPHSVVGTTYGVSFPVNEFTYKEIDLAKIFEDDNRDPLSFSMGVTSATYLNGVTAAVYGNKLALSGKMATPSTIFTIAASDGKSSSNLNVHLAPVVAIQSNFQDYYTVSADGEYETHTPLPYRLSGKYGNFAGNAPLTYSANSSDPHGVTASPSSGFLELHGALTGDATFTVTATDDTYSATANYKLLLNHQPALDPNIDYHTYTIDIPDGENAVSKPLDLTTFFHDQDPGDQAKLSYHVSTINNSENFHLSIIDNKLTYSGSLDRLSDEYPSVIVDADDGKGGYNYFNVDFVPSPIFAYEPVVDEFFIPFTSGNMYTAGDIADVDLTKHFYLPSDSIINYTVDGTVPERGLRLHQPLHSMTSPIRLK